MDIRVNNKYIVYTGNKNKKSINQNNEQSSYKENCHKKNNSKQLVLASMVLATLGLSSCKEGHNKNIENNEPSVEIMDSIKNTSSKDYSEEIDKFMTDKRIKNRKTLDTFDSNYANAYRVIYSNGYDGKGNIIKSLEIHPVDPTTSSSEKIFCPEPEYKYTTYYTDKKITEIYDNDEFQRKETEYKKKVALNGVSGYTKAEISFPDSSKIIVYEKGKFDVSDGIRMSIDGDYHEHNIYLDPSGKILGTVNYRNDKYGEIILDEKTSDLPSEF